MTMKSHEKAKRDYAAGTAVDRYFRAVNYLAAAQIYLKDNPLMEEPLKAGHVKERLLGHWGTAPGINLTYLHLNRLILKTNASVLFVTGPGHGAAANLANMYLEGALTEIYPELTLDMEGLRTFLKWFSWPDRFPSHLNPALPGVIHEGGELGYALSTSYGTVLDNPGLITVCLVGDGEAETGPTAGGWHSNKFLNPATDGAVLPILHLNGFKISSPTIFGTMTDEELTSLFRGYGHGVEIVSAGTDVHDEYDAALDRAYDKIRALQGASRAGKMPERPKWPMIILKTPKGWTGPKKMDGKIVEGSFRSHQVPGKDLIKNTAHMKAIEEWLRSYRPWELFDRDGRPAQDILSQCPAGELRMSMNPYSIGGRKRVPLKLPPLDERWVEVKGRGAKEASAMEALGQYFKDLMIRNREERNFRIVCPDELESNRLEAVLDVTNRQYVWPVPPGSEKIGPEGMVLEVLNEHNCLGWLEGYLLTGRHGVFPCYEAFLQIVDGMANQYSKFLKSALEVPWRLPISSLNFILTSEAWRQEHNGYSHQGPGFINNLLTKKGYIYRIYLPPDANTLLCTISNALASTDQINLIIASKQPMAQWLTMEEAIEDCQAGIGIWSWASTNGGEDPELVLAGCGNNLTLEVMAAARILREEAPDWRIRVVNVIDILVLGIPQKYPGGLDEARFQRIFPLDCPVLFNFHGYTSAIKQLVWERPGNSRFDINGYREEGTTTTPFDMLVRNRVSRYHLVMKAAEEIAAGDPGKAALAEKLVIKYSRKLIDHRNYIDQFGIDPPEILNWRWQPDGGRR
ncbi:MAG: phosphoketolase [Deltaproteobacteria bacterium GWC2_55_46]|nr:MAG: phosphoketolase [Deltaproteobacteria bacterium GWA2_55_82]OGQ63159.1 MAG: phosphoketolase [Deltaproteobacteria bacterium RIFCSPLOWO2_02_FULL_55_12]OIJ75048.1 MAG: phosphoketolase [Deltaproteobacteria bacterium GWC2_55_46]